MIARSSMSPRSSGRCRPDHQGDVIDSPGQYHPDHRIVDVGAITWRCRPDHQGDVIDSPGQCHPDHRIVDVGAITWRCRPDHQGDVIDSPGQCHSDHRIVDVGAITWPVVSVSRISGLHDRTRGEHRPVARPMCKMVRFRGGSRPASFWRSVCPAT
jgi:hypothetical protein